MKSIYYSKEKHDWLSTHLKHVLNYWRNILESKKSKSINVSDSWDKIDFLIQERNTEQLDIDVQLQFNWFIFQLLHEQCQEKNDNVSLEDIDYEKLLRSFKLEYL